MKSTLRAAATALSAIALAACGDSEAAKDAAGRIQESRSAAAPEAKPGLSLDNARLILPAVNGRPAVVYFTLINNGGKPVTLAAVHVEGASKAEMHETKGGTMSAIDDLQVAPGAIADFVPGGHHVMLFDLGEQLAAGGTTEMTLTFSDGDKLSAPVAIEAQGNGGDMAGMDHGDHD